MESLKHLTSGEETLMQIIWNSNAAYLKDIMLAYPEPKPHQNTVSTFLKNLVEKNYLKPNLEGRINRYEISVSKSVYKRTLLHQFVQNFYNNNEDELLFDLVDEGLITYTATGKNKDKKKKKKKKK